MTHSCTVTITALREYGSGPNLLLELSGTLMNGPDCASPIGHTQDRNLQDQLDIAAKYGTGCVTVELDGRDDTGNGPRIVRVQEVRR